MDSIWIDRGKKGWSPAPFYLGYATYLLLRNIRYFGSVRRRLAQMGQRTYWICLVDTVKLVV